MYIKKNDQQKIKTIFYTDSQIIKEYWFNISSTIKDIFNYFEKHIKVEGFSLKSNYKIFGKKINESKKISDLIKTERNDIVLECEIWIEAKEELIFDDENDEIFYKILQPKLNPFELIEFNSLNHKLKNTKIPQTIINNCELNKFSKESAFCNSYNSLYISGGAIYDKAINDFWIINKKNYKIIKQSMPIDKKNHSMIYIPDNFIFITGGDSLNTIIYDIEKQEFLEWADMNKKHYNPGLLMYGDYIYAFSALNDHNKSNNFFEKTNLTSKIAKWEIVYPNFIGNIKFNCDYFGISKYLDGNILFVGGENNNQNYLYNPMDNILSISNGNYENISFWDKTFYKISKKYNVNIPLNFNNNYQIAFIDKENESLVQSKCDKNTGLVNFDFKKDNKEGNIYIQSTIKNIKNKQRILIQTGISPKNIMKKINEYNKNLKNNKNNVSDNGKNEDFNLYSETIIIDACFDTIENAQNLNPTKANKNFQKKSLLYISDSTVDEHIIKRNVDFNLKNDRNHFEKKEKNENEENNEIKNESNWEDINKEEYILIEDLNGFDDNENNEIVTKKNLSNRKRLLYIPNSVLNDQIINRELIFNDNDKNQNQNRNNSNNISINIDKEIPEIKIENKEEEKLIINYGKDFFEQKVDNDFNKKSNKINQLLYIPSSSIDDQIIKRKVEIKDINIKMKKSLTNRENFKPYLKKRIESKISKFSEKKRNANLESKTLEENEIPTYVNTENEEIFKYNNERKTFIPEYTIKEQIIKTDDMFDDKKTI